MTLGLAAFVVLVHAAPPALPAAPPAPAGPDADVPAACKKVVDSTAEALEAVSRPLVEEAMKREDASAERGQKAFEAAMAERGPGIAALRQEAHALHATLDEADRKRCEDYGYRRFSRSLARLAPASAFYSGRGAVFRALGQAFLR